MPKIENDSRWDELYKNADPYGAGGRWISEKRRIENSFNAIPKDCRYGRALDLGCGEGHFTSMLPAIADSIVAVEISASAIVRANDRVRGQNVQFIHGNMYDVEFPDDSFDLICAVESLGYSSERASEVRKWERWLKPGGIIICTGPILPGYFKKQELVGYFSERFDILFQEPLTSKFILAKLANHGLVPFADKFYDLSMSLTRAMPSLLTKHLAVVAKSRKPLHAI